LIFPVLSCFFPACQHETIGAKATRRPTSVGTQFKGGARPRFPLEAFQGLLAGGELFGKKLQGDLTTQGQFLQP